MIVKNNSCQSDVTYFTDVCTLSVQRGRCLGNHARFYFDIASGRCLDFIYGGCEGNENNFETIEECRKTCSHHTGITVAPPIGASNFPFVATYFHSARRLPA